MHPLTSHNLIHWAFPERMWLGVMHLPLLVMPLVALLLPRLTVGRKQPQR